MTTRKTKTVAGLIVLAGVLLTAGTVWAKAETFPLPQVELEYWPTAPPGRMWITESGILHLRDIPYELQASNGDLEIHTTGVCNHNRNLVTGDGNFWGHDQTVEVTWGELTGTFRGSHSGKTIANMGYSTHVYHGISGDFEGMKLKLSGTWDFIAKNGVLEGTLMVTGAVHADDLTVSAESASTSTRAEGDSVTGSGNVEFKASPPPLLILQGPTTLSIEGEKFEGTVTVTVDVTKCEPGPDEDIYRDVIHHFDFGDDTFSTIGDEVAKHTDEPGLFILSGDMNISDGTGYFANATGKLSVHGKLDMGAGGASFKVHGTISR